MATKKISELEAITTAEDNDVLVLVDVSEGTTNKITKGNLLLGSGNQIEIDLDSETYQLVFKLKNSEGTVLSTATIDLPSENAIKGIEYENGKLTLTKQSGATSQVDISGLIEGLVTESDFNTFTQELEQTLQGINETIGAINVKNLAQDEAIEENYKEINSLKEQVTDLENNQLTSSVSGTSIDINDSASAKNKSIGLIANTTQKSTTGKQLFDANMVTTTRGGVTLYNNGDGSFSLNGTFSGNTAFQLTTTPITLQNGKTYTQSIEVISGTFNGSVVPSFKNSNDEIQYNFFNNNSTTTTTDIMTLNSYDYVISNGTTVNCTFKVQLEEGSTATDYEPYTGGEPAPNPKYPFPIKNTGDNGSINEKVQNKNLFDERQLLNATGWTETNGKYSGSFGSFNSAFSNGFDIDFEENTQYYIGFKGAVSNNIVTISINYTDNTKDNIYINQTTLTKYTKITNSSKTVRSISGSYNSGASNILTLTEFIVAKSSTEIDYIPHEEQEINFPLQEGQNFYEGDYLADDGVHHVMAQVDLSTLSWTSYATNKYATNSLKNNIKIPATIYTVPNLLATKYKAVMQGGTLANGDIAISSAGALMVCDETGTPSGIAQYPLKEEVIDPYTEEQAAAWEQIKSLRTYKPVTHISSEDEVPATVELEYVVDTKTYIDNKVTALTNAITSLGGNV